jgi:hypothetical protein
MPYPSDVPVPNHFPTATETDQAASEYLTIVNRLRVLGYEFDRSLQPGMRYYVAIMRALNEVESCRQRVA